MGHGRQRGTAAARGAPRHPGRPRQPEIHQLGARPGQHHVARLEIAVHHAGPVGPIQRVGDLNPQPQYLGHGQGAPFQARRQRLPFHQLHDQVVGGALLADVVQRADVRVVEAGNRASLALEAGADFGRFGEMLGKHLHRDLAAEPRVLRPVDFSHAAGPEGTDDLVGTEPGAG